MRLMKILLVLFLMLLICLINLVTFDARSISSIKSTYRSLKRKYNKEIHKLYNNRYHLWVHYRKLKSKKNLIN